MNILILHKGHPGQYRELAPQLAAMAGHNVVFLTQRRKVPQAPPYAIGIYKTAFTPKSDSWVYTNWLETGIGNGVGAAQACRELAKQGFRPDLVTGHANWGELLYVKDVWPNVPLIGLFENFLVPEGANAGFDPEFPERSDAASLLFTNNALIYLVHERCDAGIAPTAWQKSLFPALLQDKLVINHDGIRTDKLIPDHQSDLSVTLGETTYRRGEEIVTYVARNLEPARGFHVMMRTLPRLQELRPRARIVIVGGDAISYSAKLPEGETFRGRLTKELGNSVDWTRVHFTGQVSYDQLIAILKLSRCHVYLTVPFVLSWSMMEAMALEKTIVAADVAPVREVMEDGKTGFMVDFFKPREIAECVADVLAHEDNYRQVGIAARARIVSEFDFLTRCFPFWQDICNRHLPERLRFGA